MPSARRSFGPLVLLLLAQRWVPAASYSSGAGSCDVPGHGSLSTDVTTTIVAPAQAVAGEVVTVVLEGTAFKGFLLHVSGGSFDALDVGTKEKTGCSAYDDSATHSGGDSKTSLSFQVALPASGSAELSGVVVTERSSYHELLTVTIEVVEAGVDCDGVWSACTSSCEAAGARVWTESVAQSGSGAECPVATDCAPGEDDCPLDVDCDGVWSGCTSSCELAGDRVWTESVAQSGSGAACTSATDCVPGEDDCPVGSASPPPSPGDVACSFSLYMEDLADDGTLDPSPSGQRAACSAFLHSTNPSPPDDLAVQGACSGYSDAAAGGGDGAGPSRSCAFVQLLRYVETVDADEIPMMEDDTVLIRDCLAVAATISALQCHDATP